MTREVTMIEADRSFARCIQDVEAGEDIIITRDGVPIARLSPVAQRRVLTAEQRAAWARMEAAMDEGWDIGAGPLDRDSLHDRR